MYVYKERIANGFVVDIMDLLRIKTIIFWKVLENTPLNEKIPWIVFGDLKEIMDKCLESDVFSKEWH